MTISLILIKFTHVTVYFTLFNWYVRQKNIQIQLNLAKKLKTVKISKNNKLRNVTLKNH
jgi:hypothetical protein